jgi:hypothetical protein
MQNEYACLWFGSNEMRDPATTEFSSSKHTTQRESPRDATSALPVSAPTVRPAGGAEFSHRIAFALRPAVIVAIIAVIGTLTFYTQQLLSTSALVPSISGSWYGSFIAVRSDTGQYASNALLYVVFATNHGDQLTTTSSICTTASNGVQVQPPTAGVTATGTINGVHFTLPASGGDNESNFSWFGTYSTDTIHIDFYPNGNPTPRSPYANLHRGSYNDFLNTCKIR